LINLHLACTDVNALINKKDTSVYNI
jgi:hypothetical protein